ncbi:3-hydroxyacyl-CoA dehydrogenase family protein [Ruminococcus flavefaciens]|uniref:3-hydroxybutyryl-CoA dehydrogenase n=1 Tax=Ruminococcus flavefaciens TaxID=1265 RepID=A0A315Y151_RUMFL|nr:3-hydroxyacyl-CoA dehydrogenase family protein [Ruminococcus flavefaciens]PWJ13001.1 3-hydroxybutyryl-CoA dehydrogenase [Ruminococcus flavefaciens]CDF01357.1 zmaG [Ruminococcus sp. CAG:624]SSA48565.1 3-hydroxybutyryl-CoA dehydrogenase [Ruminococcus flavefaciens]
MEVKKVGIIGAGVMGMGIAQKMICYDKEVILVDNDASVVNSVKNRIQRNMMIARITNKDNTDIAHALSLLSVTDDYSALSGCDHIIENIPENEDMKYEVYRKLSDIVSENCICMANTSCISITKIAKWLGNSQNVIGVHFMNPVPLQKFAEVIKGNFTSDDTIEKVKSFLKEIEIDCTVINDSVGFVSNRLSHLFMNEAINLVMEGVATPEQIDQIFTEGFHHSMGPLHTADLIGLDTVMYSLNVLYQNYQDPKYRCSPLLRKMVDSGLLGRKSGKGFFEYY